MDATNAVRRPPFGSNPLVGDRGTQTQRRILAAALEAFAELGFHNTRVELITTRAGCSRPSFYQYFSSTEDVFSALASQLGRAMVEQADELGTITPDELGVDALRHWLGGFATLYEAYAPVFSAFPTARRESAPLATGSMRLRNRLGKALIRGVGSGGSALENDSLASSIVTMLARCNFYWDSQIGTSGLSRERFLDGLAQLVHRLLVGPIRGVNTRAAAARLPRRPVREWPAPTTNVDRTLGPLGERTRRRLLDAGAVVFPSLGYHDTRVKDIVEQAGVSHGSFYRYFENKDELFHVLANEASSQVSELIEAFPSSSDADALRRWAKDWFTTYRSSGGVMSMWQEIELVDPEVKAVAQETTASILDRLVRLLGRRGFGDPLVDALALFALIERLPYSVFTFGHAEEAAAIDAMVVIIRRGLINPR